MKLALVLALAAACGSSSSAPKDAAPTPPPAPPDTITNAVGAALTLLDDMAAKVAVAPDCAAAGTALRSWLDAHATERAAVTARLRGFKGREADLQREIETQAATHRQLATVFGTAGKACKDDATFGHAWADVQTMFVP